MKHLKHIHEMDDWATSNRLGGDFVYDEITERTVKNSLQAGRPPMKVKISPSSPYYIGDPSNPIDVIGTVIEFRNNVGGDEPHHVRVEWDNGNTNSYRYKDLIIEIRHVHEMNDWATSNRLGDIKGIYDEVTEETVRRSLEIGPPMRVKIKSTSGYYYEHDSDQSNPKEVIGTVDRIRMSRSCPINVQWDNGHENCYGYNDLEICN